MKLPALDPGHNVHDPQVQILRSLDEVLAIIGNLDIGKDIKVTAGRSLYAPLLYPAVQDSM